MKLENLPNYEIVAILYPVRGRHPPDNYNYTDFWNYFFMTGKPYILSENITFFTKIEAYWGPIKT